MSPGTPPRASSVRSFLIQRRWGFVAHDRSFNSQQAFGGNTSKWRLLSLSKQRSRHEMGSICRHQRPLSLRPYVSSSAEVPSVLHQQTHLPSHMSTIWTGNFSTGVHQTSEAGSASITSARVCLHVYLDDRLIWADSTEMESYQLVI